MVNINTIRTCPNCGGSCPLTTNTCIYCASINENLKSEINKIISEMTKISFENVSDENVDYLIFLYGYEDELSKIDSMKDIYINNDIKKKFDDMLANMNKKMPLEYTDLEKRFLSENILNNPKFQYNYELILREILMGNKVVSKEAFKEIIRNEVTNILKSFYPMLTESKSSATCEFKDVDECAGFYRDMDKNITIGNKTVDDLYNSNPGGLQILYHELYHSIQYFKVNNFYNDFETVYDTKEFLLHINLRDYYHENYDLIKTEKDANIFGYESAKLSLKQLGFELSEEKEKNIEEEIKKELEKREINTRKYNNEEVDFYDLFDKTIVSHPEWLEKYPQLTIEYIVDNGSVRGKTKEEFVDYVMNNPQIDEKYFEYLLDKYKDVNDTIKI